MHGYRAVTSRSLAAVGAIGCSLTLAACGASVIRAQGAEQSIVQLVSGHTGFHPTNVRCPSGVGAKAGATFQCHFTGPAGQPYTAYMRIVKVQGQRVDFYITTHPTQ